MSYILDALKRADAERERGAVPGLHSQTAAPSPTTAPVPGDGRRPLQVALALCGLLLLAAMLWWFNRADTPPPAQLPAPVPAAAPLAAAPSPEPAPTTAPATPATAQASAPATRQPDASGAPTLVAPILRPEAPVVAKAPDTPNRATTTVSSPQPAPPKAQVAEASDAGVRRFADLSPEQRAQLPLLNVNGASYSANPAHRMLIVNGAVVQEGQEIAPGLTLERIGLRQAIIRQGSLRFSIAY
jgi:general secretion pathway protein B